MAEKNITKVEKLREEGNSYFKRGDFNEAQKKYLDAMKICWIKQFDRKDKTAEDTLKEKSALVASNISVTFLKLNKLSDALDWAHRFVFKCYYWTSL